MSKDPRGPVRTVLEVMDLEKTPTGHVRPLRLDCGHVAQMAPHFSYKAGSPQHCIRCRWEADERDE